MTLRGTSITRTIFCHCFAKRNATHYKTLEEIIGKGGNNVSVCFFVPDGIANCQQAIFCSSEAALSHTHTHTHSNTHNDHDNKFIKSITETTPDSRQHARSKSHDVHQKFWHKRTNKQNTHDVNRPGKKKKLTTTIRYDYDRSDALSNNMEQRGHWLLRYR
jgi:hypothetical protein